jgi:hypothetical protein
MNELDALKTLEGAIATTVAINVVRCYILQ